MTALVDHVMSKVAGNHIFRLYRIFRQIWLTTVADWDNMDRVVTQTGGWAFDFLLGL